MSKEQEILVWYKLRRGGHTHLPSLTSVYNLISKDNLQKKKSKKLYNDPVTTTTYSYFKYVHCSLEQHFTEHPGFVGSCLSVSLLSLCVHCLLQETHQPSSSFSDYIPVLALQEEEGLVHSEHGTTVALYLVGTLTFGAVQVEIISCRGIEAQDEMVSLEFYHPN